MSICRQQNIELATLRRSLQDQRATRIVSASSVNAQQPSPQPTSTSDRSKDAEECAKMRQEIKQLEDELHESYELIDELEFEVEQVRGGTLVVLIQFHISKTGFDL